MKIRINKWLIRQWKTRQKSLQNIIEFVLDWPTTPGHVAYIEVWFIYPVRLCWRKLTSLCHSYQWQIASFGCKLSMLGSNLACAYASLVQACTHPQLLWLHICMKPVVLVRHYFLAVILSIWILQSVCLICTDPWAFSGGLWWRCII